MSDRNKYRLEKTQLGEVWDRFVSTSPNATAFAYSNYLEALPVNVDPYFCYKKQELMGAVLCIVSEDGKNVIGHEYVIYDGLMYRDLSHLNKAQRFSEEFKIQQCVAEELVALYNNVRLSLHPSIQDIRPFLWVNYGEEGAKYSPDIRYTSYISIADFKEGEMLEDIAIYNDASVARRQEIRYARKKKVVTEQMEDPEQFVFYYQQTVARQGIEVESSVLDEMHQLLQVLLNNNSCLMVQSANADGRVGSMAVFLFDQDRAYYLFGANDPEMRNQHTGTAVLWESFYMLSDLGYKEVDLEGINSPYRGWFKLSFGGGMYPYFEMNKTEFSHE